jgi:hypothetical protein
VRNRALTMRVIRRLHKLIRARQDY